MIKMFSMMLILFFTFNAQAENYCIVKPEKKIDKCHAGDILLLYRVEQVLKYCEISDEPFSIRGAVVCRYNGNEREDRKKGDGTVNSIGKVYDILNKTLSKATTLEENDILILPEDDNSLFQGLPPIKR